MEEALLEVLLQDEDAVIKDVDTKVEDVVLGTNVVAMTMPITTAGTLLSMTRVVITAMHIHGKCVMAILMDRIIGQDFSLNPKVPQVAAVEMVEDSNLDVEMEAVVMTPTRMITLHMQIIRPP